MTNEEFQAFLDRVRTLKPEGVVSHDAATEIDLPERIYSTIDSLNDDQFKLFVDAFNQNQSIKHICIREPRRRVNANFGAIGPRIAKLWSNLLAYNRNLKTFSFYGNVTNVYMGDEGAKSIAQALELNSTLESLSLVNQGISDKGIECIATALTKNSSLTALDLTANRVTKAGERILANAILHNYKLRSLSTSPALDNEEYTDLFGSPLTDAVQKRNTIAAQQAGCCYSLFCYANSNEKMVAIYRNEATGNKEFRSVPALCMDLYKRIWEYVGVPHELTLKINSSLIRQYGIRNTY